MPDADNNFGGSLGLDFRKWWRHVQPKNCKLLYLRFPTCEVTCEVKREMTITFQVNSCGTNELEKYKKRVVQRHIFVQGTLAIDQNQSPALPQRWTASKRAGCPARRPVFFLSRLRPNVGRLWRPGAVRVQPCIPSEFKRFSNLLALPTQETKDTSGFCIISSKYLTLWKL